MGEVTVTMPSGKKRRRKPGTMFPVVYEDVEDIAKYNHAHDENGRFAISAGGHVANKDAPPIQSDRANKAADELEGITGVKLDYFYVDDKPSRGSLGTYWPETQRVSLRVEHLNSAENRDTYPHSEDATAVHEISHHLDHQLGRAEHGGGMEPLSVLAVDPKKRDLYTSPRADAMRAFYKAATTTDSGIGKMIRDVKTGRGFTSKKQAIYVKSPPEVFARAMTQYVDIKDGGSFGRRTSFGGDQERWDDAEFSEKIAPKLDALFAATIQKFNQNHDSAGRFSSGAGGNKMTIEYDEGVGGYYRLKTEEAVAQSEAAIRAAHGGNLPMPVKVRVRKLGNIVSENGLALVAWYNPAQPGILNINGDMGVGKASLLNGTTITHEYGHAVEFEMIKAGKVDSGMTYIEVGGTRTITHLAQLERNPGATDSQRVYASYLSSQSESFARAYAQWVTGRSGDVDMAEQITSGSHNNEQWPEAEFKPVAEAFDAVFGTDVKKFNQNHDNAGRFSSGSVGALLTGLANGGTLPTSSALADAPLYGDSADRALFGYGSYDKYFSRDRFEAHVDHVASDARTAQQMMAGANADAVKRASDSLDIHNDISTVEGAAFSVSTAWNHGSNSGFSLDLQDAVGRNFHTATGSPEMMARLARESNDLVYAHVPATGDRATFMDEYARTTYSNTQQYLASKGVRKVTLYRGIRQAAVGADYQPRPLSSWSTMRTMAAGFAGVGGTVMTADIPASDIFSIGGKGPGSTEKHEVLVLGRNQTISTDISKYNHNHGSDGRFSSGAGGNAGDMTDVSYRGSHTAPSNDGFAQPLGKAIGAIYPDDLATHPEYYAYHQYDDTPLGRAQARDEYKSAAFIVKVQRHEQAKAEGRIPATRMGPMTQVFRAVPKTVKGNGEKLIQNGDWVTISKAYAIQHGESNLNGEFRVVSRYALAKHLYTDGNDLLEWGYDTSQEVHKYNHAHDELGRFSTGDGGAISNPFMSPEHPGARNSAMTLDVGRRMRNLGADPAEAYAVAASNEPVSDSLSRYATERTKAIEDAKGWSKFGMGEPARVRFGVSPDGRITSQMVVGKDSTLGYAVVLASASDKELNAAMDDAIFQNAASTLDQAWRGRTNYGETIGMQDAAEHALGAKGISLETYAGSAQTAAYLRSREGGYFARTTPKMMGAYMKASYAQTQDYLKANGIKNVAVYRGLRQNSPEHVVPEGDVSFPQRPLSSWTASAEVTTHFNRAPWSNSGVNGYRVQATIPAERVFSIGGRGGPASLGEYEVVVLSDGIDRAKVSRVDDDGLLPGETMRQLNALNLEMDGAVSHGL